MAQRWNTSLRWLHIKHCKKGKGGKEKTQPRETWGDSTRLLRASVQSAKEL